MGVFDEWEEGAEYMDIATTNIDLAAPDGFRRLEARAYHDVLHLLDNRYDELAGLDLRQVADDLTRDFLQESVSLPKGAFADPETAGREMAIIKYAYRHFVGLALGVYASEQLRAHMAFPSGRLPMPTQAPTPAHQPRRRQS